MKIIKFEWDNAKDEEHNGKQLIIGIHLPKKQNHELSYLEVYGISLDIVDNSKDYRLKRFSCHNEQIITNVSEISKEQARALLIEKIDEALEVMFDSDKMNPKQLIN